MNDIKKSFFGIIGSLKDIFSFECRNKVTFIWKVLFFCSLLASISFSTIFQSPFFAENGFNVFSIVLWIVTFIFAIIVDFKKVIYYSGWIIIFVFPFVAFCCLMLAFKTNYFSTQIFRLLIQSLIILLIGMVSCDMLNKKQIKFAGMLFVLSSFILSFIIVVTKVLPSLKGLTDSTYIYESKNSSAPILVASGTIALFLSKNKTFKIISWIYYFYIFLLVFIIKCRAVIIVMPFLSFYLIFKLSNNKKLPLYLLIGVILAFLLIILIPPLNDLIIQKMLFNNKTNIDDIFSGRFTYIYKAFSSLNILKGTPSYYVDCMPILLLCNFGIFGFLLLLPIVLFPFYLTAKIKNESFKTLSYAFLILYYFNSLLEGYGIFGPGAKAFIFWIILGVALSNFLKHEQLCSEVATKVSPRINKIELSYISLTMSALLMVSGFAILVSPSINTLLSGDIFNRIESAISNEEYIYAKSIEFSDENRTTFCVGQKYTFQYAVLPENTTDKSLHPEGWGVGKDVISFEKGNKITATFHKKCNFNLNVYSEKVTSLHSTTLIKVVDPEEFPFDDLFIWAEEDGEVVTEMTILKGQKKPICFDTNYVPSLNLISFETNNDLVASINDNVVSGLSEGTCFVQAFGANGLSSNKSNLIKVNVIDNYFVAPDSIDCSINSDLIFTNTEYELPVNYHNNSVDDYVVYLNDQYYGINSRSIVFSSCGYNEIKISSLSDSSVSSSIIVNDVHELKPVQFVAKENWFVISDGPKEIDLEIEYNDGSIRKVKPDDIQYDYANKDNRADKYNSGIIGNDGLLFYPLKPGTKYLKYVAQANKEITIDLKTTTSKYTFKEKYINTLNVGLCISLFLVITANACFFSTNRKHNLLFNIFGLALFIVMPFMFLLFNSFNAFSVISIIVAGLLSIALYLLLYYIKKKTKIDSMLPSSDDIKIVRNTPISIYQVFI